MGTVIKAVLGTAALFVALGSLGIGIASLVILINVQDVQNNQLDATAPTVPAIPTTASDTSTASTKKSSIPVAKPIQDNDPRYAVYKSVTEHLESWMNTSLNPCDHFYEFSCGAAQSGQKEAVDVAADFVTESMLRLLRQPPSFFDNDPLPVRQLKWFYDACLVGASDEEYANRSARLFNDMREANPGIGFPALYQGETMGTSSENLAMFLGYSTARSGMYTLIWLKLEIDDKDPHNAKGGTAFKVDQPITLYSSSQYPYQDKADIVNNIVDTLNSGAKLLGIKDVDQNKLREDAEDIAQFDYDLATKYSTDATTRRKYERSYNPYTIDGLQQLAPFIEWTTFFNKALSPIATTVDGSFRVIVNEVDKLALLSADIVSGAVSSRTINNYLYFNALRNYLPPPVPPQKSESQCLWETPYNALIWANSRLFVDAIYPTPKSRQTVREKTNSFVRSLIAGFQAQIDLIAWMTPASKKGAYQKLDNLVVNIAFPDWILEDAKLTEYYKKLDTNSKDTYLDHLDKNAAFERYDDFASFLIVAPFNRTDWPTPLMEPNAMYRGTTNSITINGGILQAPYYDVDYPAAVNFGSLASVAGHEIGHGFDDGGVQYDGTGVLLNWMDANSTRAFNKMAQCIINQYDSFCPQEAGVPCVNGAQTQGENIADNGGIQAAYKAFKAYEALNGPDPLLPGDASQFSADQLFFLSFAQNWCTLPHTAERWRKIILTDEHAPNPYRVQGTIQNMPAFRKAFNCPVGSAYAPAEHCNIWTSEPTSGAPLDKYGIPMVPDNDLNIAPVERISAKEMDKYSAYENSLATLKLSIRQWRDSPLVDHTCPTLAASSNLSVDPCEDFYHYSCGAFPGPKNTFYDLDQANYRIINDKLNDAEYQPTIKASTALSKLQTLYNSCKAEAKESTIGKTNYLDPKVLNFRKYINQDIPLLGGTGKLDLTPEDFGNALGYLSFQLGIDTLATPLVDTNWMDPQATKAETKNGYQLFVDQPTTYHARAFYEDANWDKQKPDYKKTVKTLIDAYAKMDRTTQLPDDYEQMIDDALDLEKTIAITYSGTDEERSLYLRQWNKKMLNELPATVDWNMYFTFAPQEAQDWIENKEIVINEFAKTSDLFTYLANSDASTVINYLLIRLLLANTGLIPCSDGKCASLMRELAVRKVPEHTGKSRVPHRRHTLPAIAPLNDDNADRVGCAEEIAVMADAHGRVYIDARFPSDEEKKTIRNATMGVMNNIVDAMKGMIVQLDWMSEDSKANALKKASNIQINVVYPDFILNDVELDAKYEDLVFDKDDSYYDMLDKVTVHSINEQFKLLISPKADRTDFLGQTAVANAWYEPELNSITLPAGILQQPYFDVNYPAGLNYGGIGVVAGHELTHGFDDEGVQWDYDGRLNSWMDANSQLEFDSMAQCVIDEYGNFCPIPTDHSPHCIDGIRTQGENIADNGGIHAAWRAYQSHLELDGPDALFMDKLYAQYSENQLFFLNFAQEWISIGRSLSSMSQGWCMQKTYLTESYVSDRLMTDPHSLGYYRVLGTLQNIPAFQTNFNCPKGSKYAPEQHCSVWVPRTRA